jgi:hypothetical protein
VGQRGPEHDLHHFAANLAATTDVRAIKQTCMEVQRVIEGRGAGGVSREVPPEVRAKSARIAVEVWSVGRRRI